MNHDFKRFMLFMGALILLVLVGWFTRGIWTLSWLGLLILVIAGVFIWLKPGYNREKREYNVNKGILYLALFAPGLASLYTLKNYVFPEKDVFQNLDYHVVEHLGIEFGDSLHLVNDRVSQIAFWDQKAGRMILKNEGGLGKLELAGVFEPLFCKKSPESNYRLVNNFFPHDIRNGFELATLAGDTQWVSILKLRVKEYDEGDLAPWTSGEQLNTTAASYHVIFKDKAEKESDFKRKIGRGYPLVPILEGTAQFIDGATVDMLEGSYLLRDNRKSEDSLGNLVFVPGHNLFDTSFCVISGTDTFFSKELSAKQFNQQLEEGGSFYFGLDKSGVEKWVFHSDKSKGQLLYAFPPKQPLKKNDTADLFITSSSLEILQNDYQEGYFYPLFQRDDHALHFNGNLEYISGSAADSLVFRISDQYEGYRRDRDSSFLAYAGDTLHFSSSGYIEQKISLNDGSLIKGINVPQLKPRRGELVLLNYAGEKIRINKEDIELNEPRDMSPHWLFRVHDLRDSSPVSISHLLYLFLGYLGLVFLILASRSHRKPLWLETLLYLVVMYFLVVRFILMWRIATFPPIKDIEGWEWNEVRSSYSYDFTLWIVGAFLVLSFFAPLIKGLLLRFVESPLVRGLRSNERAVGLIYAGILIALYGGNFLIGIEQLTRYQNIGIPVALYFMGFILFNKAKFQRTKKERINPIFDIVFLLHTMNWGLCSLTLVAKDMGFFIIFLVFSLVVWSIRLLFTNEFDYWRHSEGANKPVILALPLAILSLGMAIFMVYYHSAAIIWVFDHPGWLLPIFSIVTILIGGGLGFWWFRYRPVGGGKTRIISACVLVGLGGGLLLSGELGLNQKVISEISDKEYVKYRAHVLQSPESLEKVIQSVDFDSEKNRKLREASQNNWFIHQYMGSPDGYFELQKHFDKGVSYIDQMNDLVALRYLVAEHPFQVMALLCLLLLSMVIAVFRLQINSSLRIAMLMVTVFLLLAALLVWLTATNRFVFFGQDFPLLSIRSTLTIALTLFLLLIVILGYDEEEDLVPYRFRLGNYFYNSSSNLSIHNLIISGPFVLAFVALIFLKLQSSPQEENDQDPNTYSLGKVLEQTQSKFSQLNESFRYFQASHRELLKETVPVDDLITAFHDWNSVDGEVGNHLKPIYKDESDNFSSSVFDYFLDLSANEKRNPSQILHLKRPEGNFYEFAVNNLYYKLSSPRIEKASWEGSLLSAPQTPTLKLYSRNKFGERPLEIPGDRLIENVFAPSGEKKVPFFSLAGYKLGNLSLTILPAEWFPDGSPLVLVSNAPGQYEDLKGNFRVVNRHYLFNSGAGDGPESFFSHRIEDKDNLSLYDQNNNPLKLKLVSGYEQYLAKNFWVNGERRLFYPLEDKFTWPYLYANHLKNYFGKNPDYLRENVRTTLDYYLTDKLNLLLRKYYRAYRDPRYKKRSFSISVVDHKGRIRSMVEYEPPVDPGEDVLNPNDDDFMNKLYQKYYSESNHYSERRIFGNLCLLRMSNGPGSSIKPIMYSAVMSGARISWDKLDFYYGDPSSLFEEVEGEKRLMWYGGKRFPGESGWKIQKHDKGNFTAKRYLKKSSNLYHSLIMFLGSYNETALTNRLESDILIAPPKDEKERFPLMDYNGRRLVFNPKKWPKDRNKAFSNTGSVLAKSLRANFDLYTSIQGASNTEQVHMSPAPVNNDSALKSLSQYRLWSYPELSHFYQADRSRIPMVDGIRQSTVGGYPISVNPLKMAEMGGRVASLNRNLIATLDTGGIADKYEFFELGQSWQANEYLAMHERNVMGPMRNVLAGGDDGGTASFLSEYLTPGGSRGFFFYAKTGTINSSNKKIPNDRHLLLIISRENLHDNLSLEKLQRNRFYSIYITLNQMGGFNEKNQARQLIKDIIETIVESPLFRDYMSEEEVEND